MEQNNLERLLAIGTDGPAVEVNRGRKHKHPSGWVPGVSLTGDSGTIVTEPRGVAPGDNEWDEILDELLPPGIDRSNFQIDTKAPVEVRAWDAADGQGGTNRMYYFKARILRRIAEEAAIDLKDLIDSLVKKKIKAPALAPAEDRAYFLQITDLQAGQADGDGVEGLVKRALELSALAKQDIASLKKSGRPVSQVFLPITGDLVEGIDGWYAMQTFSVALDRREQTKLVRRVLTEVIADIASLGLPVHVAVVPGNHGENRQNGKAYTTLGDNDDVAVVEAIADAFAFAGQYNEALNHVTFSFPGANRIHLTVEVLGWVVGLTHGHVARYGTGVEGKLLNWFKSMSAGRDPIGDSDILFTGHYHHARFQQLIGDTTWVQGGALCDASAWFSQSAGLVSDPIVMKGTITRSNKIEALIPHSWPRTRPETRKVG